VACGKQGKNDAAIAAAICEAVQRPNMQFVPIKAEEQQSRLMCTEPGRATWLLVCAPTAPAGLSLPLNGTRLREYGLIQ
jgi:hypothetical protein